MTRQSQIRRARQQALFGCVLVAACWTLNWGLEGLRTHILFFPLWFGYVLTVDALVLSRAGSSLLSRDPLRFALCFAVSVPLWWLFEAINLRTQNWLYHGAEEFTPVAYALLASAAFSTVVPAVIESAELTWTFGWMRRFASGPRLPSPARFSPWLFAAGWTMLILVLASPEVFYPLVWGAAYAIIEPVNAWRKKPTLIAHLHEGDWRPLVALSVGSLLCGFFWEMWNYGSYPRWTYHTPGVDTLYVFEMPLLGYIGYLPFAWEVYAFLHFPMPGRQPLLMDEVKSSTDLTTE